MTYINVHSSNFGDYLKAEENNLRLNLKRLADFPDIVTALDQLWHYPTRQCQVSPNDGLGRMIGLLYARVHECYYAALATYLRCHLYDGLAVSRQSIDAAFTAYKLFQEPDRFEDYVNGQKYFEKIKSSIKRELSSSAHNEPNKLPMRQDLEALVDAHEYCSTYASHADLRTFSSLRVVIDDDKLGAGKN